MGNKPFKDEGKLSTGQDANVFQRLLNKQEGNFKDDRQKVEKSGEDGQTEIGENEDGRDEEMENGDEGKSELMDSGVDEFGQENEVTLTLDLMIKVEDGGENESQQEEEIDTGAEKNKETLNEELRDEDLEDGNCEETLHEYSKRKCRNYWRLIEIQEESETEFEQIYESENQLKCFQDIEHDAAHVKEESFNVEGRMLYENEQFFKQKEECFKGKEECFKEGEEFSFVTPKSSGSSKSLSNNQNEKNKSTVITKRKSNRLTDYEDNSESNFLVINVEQSEKGDEDFPKCQSGEKYKSNKSTTFPNDEVKLGISPTSVTIEESREKFETNDPDKTSKHIRIYKNDGPITEICLAKTTLYENLSDDAKDALTSLEANYTLVESDKAALAFLTTIDTDDSTKGNLAIALLDFVCDDVRTCVLEHLASQSGLRLEKNKQIDEKSDKTMETSGEYSQIHVLQEYW